MALIPFPLYHRLIQLLDEDEVDQLYELNPVADIVNDDDDNFNALLESVSGPQAVPKMVDKSTMTDPLVATSQDQTSHDQTSHDIHDPLEGTSTMYNHMFTPKQKPLVLDSEPWQKPQDPLEGTLQKQKPPEPLPQDPTLQKQKPLVAEPKGDELWDDDSDSEPFQRVDQQKQKPPRKVKFACTQCSSHFYTHAALSRHMLREHPTPARLQEPPPPRDDDDESKRPDESTDDDEEEEPPLQDEEKQPQQDESTEQPQDEEEQPLQDKEMQPPEQDENESTEQPLKEQSGRKRRFEQDDAQRKRKFDEESEELVESKKGRPKSSLQLRCDYCPSTYKTKGGLMRHVLNIHGLDLKDEDWMMDTEPPRNKRKQSSQGGKITKKLKQPGRKRKSNQTLDEPVKKRGKPQKATFSIWKPRK